MPPQIGNCDGSVISTPGALRDGDRRFTIEPFRETGSNVTRAENFSGLLVTFVGALAPKASSWDSSRLILH
jgi:hypothetical protein